MGSGERNVLLWSQMHGNESTATRAIIDLVNLNSNPGRFAEEWQAVLEELTLCIIPMLNPDGAARFTRRNAAAIDLNRDARAFACPESVVLRDAIEELSPAFSFNLHDQRRFYNIEGTPKPSTISFLAPAFDADENVNESRLQAMQLIAAIRHDLEEEIPDQVGLYNDSYAVRAFGDYSQAQGSPTILIESGWEKYDIEKEFVRKLNFALLASSLKHIADGSFQAYSEVDYRSIPMNDEKLFDVLLRKVTFVQNNRQVSLDLGLQREEITIAGTTEFYSKGRIEDLGDLQEWYGFEEVEADELMLVAGKIAQISLAEYQKLEEADQAEYIKLGNLFIVGDEQKLNGVSTGEMINIVPENADISLNQHEGPANFLLINRAGEIKYIILNGFLWPIDEAPPEGLNGLYLS